jgi:hypothetical protein
MIPGTIYKWFNSDLYVMFLTLRYGIMIKRDNKIPVDIDRLNKISWWCDCTCDEWKQIT